MVNLLIGVLALTGIGSGATKTAEPMLRGSETFVQTDTSNDDFLLPQGTYVILNYDSDKNFYTLKMIKDANGNPVNGSQFSHQPLDPYDLDEDVLGWG